MGAPWEAWSQERPKSKLGGCFFKLKRQEYTNLFLNAFLIVFGAPWGSKNEHFVLEGLQKSTFQEVAFQHRFETNFGRILGSKLGPSWSQVGPNRVQNCI